jgi:ketosteroid isomerase-like protein
MNPPPIVRHLQQAINDHDLDAIEACFDPDYASDQPAHPARSFRGRPQLRENWTQILAGVPDLKAELKRSAVNGREVWTEWEWRGTRRDGSPSVMRGVTIQGLRDDVIAWVHFYMEPVDESGAGVEQAISEQVSGRRES